MHCDLLLENGHCITLDATQAEVRSLAIHDGKILWLGERWSGTATERIDLKGAYVYPGLIDAHLHLFYTGLVQSYLQLGDCRSQEEVFEKVAEKALKTPSGDWIIGVGWDDHHWPKKDQITASALDKVSPNHPVVLQRTDTHLMWVNSQVLNKARIDRETPDPIGGVIGRDPHGHPNGILVDLAMIEVRNVWPFPTFEEKLKISEGVINAFLKKGLTTVHNAATDKNDFEIFHTLAERKQLKLRIYGMITIRNAQENPFVQEGPRSFGDFFQLRCLKFWMDGAIGSRGAALVEPYSDDPRNRGLLLWEEKELLPLLRMAKEKEFQVATHAIGDRAAHEILDAYEKIGVKALRWRIEHAQQLLPDDISRFAENGIIASMQPLHAIYDAPFLEQRLGKERVERGAFAWRALLDDGTHVAGGSDAPVVDFNPLKGIDAASRLGLTRLEALKMYTLDAAYASFQENELGSLTVGKWADLAIFPENLLTCPSEKLVAMDALYTVVNGKIQ